MFSKLTGAFYGLILFYIVRSPQYVSGHVMHWSRAAVEPVSTPSLGISNGSLLRYPNDASASLSQEEPPWELRVEYFWKYHAGTFGRIDFLNTIIFTGATMAIRPWNTAVQAYRFPAPFNIAIGFVSDRSGPGLQVKHVLWTLEEIFDIIMEQDRYLPGNVVIQLVPITLGVANVIATRADSASFAPMDLLSADSANTTTGSPILSPTSTGAPLANLTPSTDSNLTAVGNVKIHLWYRPDGTDLEDVQVYNASLKLMIQAGEPADASASIWPGITTYNDMDDFTFTMRPESFAARQELSWYDTIYSLAAIAPTMCRRGGMPGQFAELDGRITAGQYVVGRFCLDKGDKSGRNLMDLCTTVPQGGADSVNGVAVA